MHTKLHVGPNTNTWIGIAAAAVMALLAVSSIGAEISDNHSWSHGIWSACTNVAASLTAAALCALLVRIFNEREFVRRRKRFMGLLGIDSPDQRVGIVLPRFDLEHGAAADSPYDPPIKDGAIKDTRLAVRAQLAFDDVVAVRHITTLFGELGLTAPVVLFDREARTALFEEPPPGTDSEDDASEHEAHLEACKRAGDCAAFIVIGLFSNRVTMQFDAKGDVKLKCLFKLTSQAAFRAGRRGILVRARNETEANWLKARENCDSTRHFIERNAAIPAGRKRDQEDLALIARCRGPGSRGKICLIVGGAAARGTRKAAEFLALNWEDMLEERIVGDVAGSVAGNYFAAIYRLPQGARAELTRGDLAISR